MSVRITNLATLDALVAKGMIPQGKVEQCKQSLAKTSKLSKSAAKQSGSDRICSLVPLLPADILYQAICQRFGRFYEGGLAVYELEFSFANRKFRADVGLPEYKLIVELDGWEYHGKYLDGFKKDREKSLIFERRGWSVIRFSGEQVRTGIHDALDALQEVMSFKVRQPQLRQYVKPVLFDKSQYNAAY